MKHTIYLTSGQTAEVMADGSAIEDGASIYFELGGREVARFRKGYVSGQSWADEISNKSGRLDVCLDQAQEFTASIDRATGAVSGWKP